MYLFYFFIPCFQIQICCLTKTFLIESHIYYHIYLLAHHGKFQTITAKVHATISSTLYFFIFLCVYYILFFIAPSETLLRFPPCAATDTVENCFTNITKQSAFPTSGVSMILSTTNCVSSVYMPDAQARVRYVFSRCSARYFFSPLFPSY